MTAAAAPAMAEREARFDRLERDIAEVTGLLNAAHGRLVDLVGQALDEDLWQGWGLHSPAGWLAWQGGLSPARARNVVTVAQRRAELPTATGALRAGELTLDAAIEIAKRAPAAYEANITTFARAATVTQLQRTLRHYAYDDATEAERPRPVEDTRSVAMGTDDTGWWLKGRLPLDEGAVIEAAIAAACDDLARQAATDHRTARAAEREAGAANSPSGEAGADADAGAENGTTGAAGAATGRQGTSADKPPPVTNADGLLAVAEASLRSGEAAHPGTDRYLVHLHLDTGPGPTPGSTPSLDPNPGPADPTADGDPEPDASPTARPDIQQEAGQDPVAGAGADPSSPHPSAAASGPAPSGPATPTDTVAPASAAPSPDLATFPGLATRAQRASGAIGASGPAAPGAGPTAPGATTGPGSTTAPGASGGADVPSWSLSLHLGPPLPAALRGLLLCDVDLRPVFEATGIPLSVGRKTRVVPRRLRRLIERRDGGCAVPGCHRRHGLEIHHIIHWEHGGPTDTWNCLCLCRYHHRAHHLGLLGISGNPERHDEGGLRFTDPFGRPLGPTGRPAAPIPDPTGAAGRLDVDPGHYIHPLGERLQHDAVYFNQRPRPHPDPHHQDPNRPSPNPHPNPVPLDPSQHPGPPAIEVDPVVCG